MKDFPVSIPSPLGREHRSQRKILFVNAGIRDFLSHRLHLAYRMREVGFEVHVAGPVELGIDKIIAEGFRFHPIPLRRKSANPAHEIRCLLALVNLYRKLKPSIVHQFMLKPSLYGGIAARVLDSGGAVSMITGFGHLTMAENLQARLLRIPVRWGLRFALGSENAVAMFQNPDDRELFVKSGIVRASDSCLIPGSGIDPAEFFPTPEPSGTPIVLLAGRMLWVKGVGEFVSAARILRKSGSTARFALAGQIDSGHPSDVSLQQLHAWETEGIVEWWGWHDDVPALVSSVTLCCLPSYREGLPRVLVEACAGGRAKW
jgi:glycosyltransferase involved in cell wall biosynthesis